MGYTLINGFAWVDLYNYSDIMKYRIKEFDDICPIRGEVGCDTKVGVLQSFIRHISVLLAVPVVGGVFDTIGDVWNVEVDYTIGFRI